jgi:DNA-directed RNA polymerase subunit B
MALSSEDRWAVMKSFFLSKGLVRQHLDSYNHFVERRIQQIVSDVGKIEPDIPNYYVRLGRVEIQNPSVREADGSVRNIAPAEARIRNLTYSSPIYLEMTPVYRDEKTGMEYDEETTSVYVGRLPIMLKSAFCRLSAMTPDELVEAGEDPNDPGGYFIINGSERVLVTQEDLAPNRILIEEATSSSSCTHMAKVFSTARGFRAPVTMERRADHTFRVSFPSVPGKIPLVVLMRALGLVTDREIVAAITDDPTLAQELIPSFHAAESLVAPKDPKTTRENALDYIGKRVAVGQTKDYRLRRAEQVLNRYLLPHIGTDSGAAINKAHYVGQMTQRLIELSVNRRLEDDKDHYANKRLKLAGDLLTSLFRVAFLNLCRDIKYQLERTATRGRKPNIKTAVRADVITERLRHALATGNWVGGKAGVSQLLDRVNYMSSISHLRRVVSPLSRSQPHFEARDLHPTHWGKICCAPDTNVLLGDGVSQVQIGKMENNFERFSVMTVDKDLHNGIPSDLIAYQRISASEMKKEVLEINTITGRTVRATEDHPFLTPNGWVDAGNLGISDKVLIRPTLEPLPLKNEKESKNIVILGKEEFLRGKWKDALPEDQQQLVEGDFEELLHLGLLPLTADHSKLPIIARLFGSVITDGAISKTVEFYVGSQEDGNAINQDLEVLGFSTNPVLPKKSSFDQDEYTSSVDFYTYRTTKGGAFQRLMVALGAPVGKRSEQLTIIPEWLISCDLEVKREFLAAYMGGDGAAPWYYRRHGRKDSYKIYLPEISIHKHPTFVESQIQFFKLLQGIFEEFSVRINKIKTKPTKNPDRISVDLVFSSEKDNILRLCQNIGFRYCAEKRQKAQLIGEFLAFRKEEITQRMRDQKRVIGLYNQGLSPKEISLKLDIGYRIVTSIVQRRSQLRNSVRPKSSWSIGKFFEETRANKETGMLFVPINSINATDEDIVCDFTTALDTHSFIANGFVTHNCPNETPEGPNCGLVKNLALMSYISVGSDEAEVEEALLSLKVQPLDAKSTAGKKGTYVYLNGRFVGNHTQPELLVTRLRDRRQRNELSDQVNLAFYPDTNEVEINSDAGRVRRALIIVKDGIPLLEKQHVERIRNREISWDDLVKAGIIEYLDAEEEENTLIAMNLADITPEHTHLEIVPETILGICASLVPFAEHNQSPRNTYEAGMAKQALGLYSANFSLRVDTRSHILHYVQSPIVTTRPMEVIGYHKRPAGQNFIVAIHSFQGYNIEDALVINKASIERGIARSSFFRSYDAEERKYPGGQEDKFEIPSREVRGYRASEAYRLLSEDGIIEPEFQVGGDEILIGRTSPPRFLEEYTELEVPGPKRRETSISLRHGEEGTIDKVLITETIDGNRLVKVKVRDERIPELGDKFASRHGQKGVIGLLAPQEDMPFTETGIVPDLVVNAHAFPSRMTLGQILESMGGKIGCLQGEPVDATPFSGKKLEEMFRELHELGFKYSGRETMYNGVTGHKYDVDLFIGVVYYQKLHHLVADKMHARARGPVQILTRQPTEGRAREGGLRFGEMERDCLIGHGAALLLRERLLEESDKYTAMVCEECGMLAEYDRNRDRYRCRVCAPKTTTISKVEMSYAFKLVLQELISLGIWPRLKLTDRT